MRYQVSCRILLFHVSYVYCSASFSRTQRLFLTCLVICMRSHKDEVPTGFHQTVLGAMGGVSLQIRSRCEAVV